MANRGLEANVPGYPGCAVAAYATISAMAKKKHQPKKHTFKHASPAGAPITGSAVSSPKASSTAAARSTAPTDYHDYSYVNHDLRRVVIMASGLIVLELALWLAMDFTALGGIVYGLIKL